MRVYLLRADVNGKRKLCSSSQLIVHKAGEKIYVTRQCHHILNLRPAPPKQLTGGDRVDKKSIAISICTRAAIIFNRLLSETDTIRIR